MSVAKKLVEWCFAQPFISAIEAETFERDIVRLPVACEKCFARVRQAFNERAHAQFRTLRAVEPLIEIVKIRVLAMTVFITPDL
ncbi:hypothetical protein DXU04_42840 [Bradyrhizobium diazoefficiens]